MADNKTVASATPTPTATPSSTEQMLAQALAQIAGLMEKQSDYNKFAQENAPRRKKSMAEYLQQNPRKRLLREVYQNGRPVNPKGLSQATIARLDTFATGTYCDGLIDVVRIKDGLNGINSRIHIFYNNKHEHQKYAFYMRFQTFTKIVDDVVADMARLGIEPVHEAVADPIEEIPVVPE
jgi:hypothetical protein